MTVHDGGNLLADSFDDFDRRHRDGERPRPEDYQDSLGNSYVEFLKVIEGKQALDRLLEPVLEPPLPREFGSYLLLRELGRGATSVVYEAEHRATGKRVALKALHAGFDSDTRERFRREAKACSDVRHESLVEMYDADEIDDRPYYTMTLVEGPTLKGLIAAGHRPDPAQLCEGLAGVAEALQALHDAHKLHRDVKPQNIVIARNGRYVLTDFGLARSDAFDTITRTGQALGTPLYMSPEQVCGDRAAVDHRTDIYGLGATLYEALTGTPVFNSKEIDTLSGMILTRRPVPPGRLTPGLPASCDAVTLKALEKRRQDRYQSASDMAHDLSAVAAGRTAKGKPVSISRRGARWLKARWPVAAVLVALMAIPVAVYLNRPARILVTTVPTSQMSVNGVPTSMPEGGLEVDAGTVELRFEREGFDSETRVLELAAGEVHSEEIRLRVIDANDPVALKALNEYMESFGVTVEPFKVKRRRGVEGEAAAILPAGLVRAGHLGRYRFELYDQEAFAWGGRLFFERGGELLHEADFEPTALATEATLPAEVLEALRPGDEITWGYRREDGPEYVNRFRVATEEEVPLADLERASVELADQPPAVRVYFLGRLLTRAGLLTEAANVGREATDGTSILPYGIVNAALEELKLGDSNLATEARETMRSFDDEIKSAWIAKSNRR